MGKKLNVGDTAFAFSIWEYNNGEKYTYSTCVKIIECKNSEKDNSEVIYIGKDVYGHSYEGAYGNLLDGEKNYFYTYKDYMEILEKQKKENDEILSKLQAKEKDIQLEIAKTSRYMQNQKKEEEMLKCRHLFVKLKEGLSYSGFHSSDYGRDPSTVVCVHCGLTNRYSVDNSLNSEFSYLYSTEQLDYFEMHNRIIRMKYNKGYSRGGKYFNDNVFRMISQKELKTRHPVQLYYMAKQISPEGKNKELFAIMKKIHYEIETPEEKRALNTIQIEDIIERYKESTQVKKLTKQKSNN